MKIYFEEGNDMGSILMDSWTLETGVFQALNSKASKLDNEKKCWQLFLSSLILWDNIENIVRDPGYHYWWQDELNKKQAKVLKKCVNQIDLNAFENSNLPQINYLPFAENIQRMFTPNNQKRMSELLVSSFEVEQAMSTVSLRADNYRLLSRATGLNYMPHPLRAKYLMEQDIEQQEIQRNEIIPFLDKEVMKVYESVNKRYEKKRFTCSYPLLYDYIRQNSASPTDELIAALKLRKRKDVVAFRKSMDKLDEKLSMGDVIAADIIASQIEEEVNEIAKPKTKNSSNGKWTYRFVLSIPPRFEIEKSVEKTNNPQIRNKDKIINTVFLSRLADFALHEQAKRFI